VIVRSAEPDGERRRSLQSNTSFVGLRDFLLDGALYPLLVSDDEAERERAYVRLREQVERMPESLVRPANEILAGRPAVDSCPECPDTAEKFPICQPEGCDLAEVVFSKSQGQGRTVRERKVLPLR
jgi:hypothetical protein